MSGTEPQPEQPDTVTLLRRVIDIISGCRTLPLSSSVKLDNKDEVIELLEEATSRFPDELRQARWMLRERAEFVAKTQREADEILGAARVRAERMVQRAEIVREAQHAAEKTIEKAKDHARALRHEAEDYCDQKLAAFEIVLERTMKTVQSGREKLAVTPIPPVDEGPGLWGSSDGGTADTGSLETGADGAVDDMFFDQDHNI
jgi:hypothetical protein